MSFWSGSLCGKENRFHILQTLIQSSLTSHRPDGKGWCASQLVNWPWDPQLSLENLGLHGYQVARREPEPQCMSIYDHVLYIYIPSPKSIEKLATWTIYGKLHLNPFLSFWRLLNGYTNMFLHHPILPRIQSPVMYVNMLMDGTVFLSKGNQILRKWYFLLSRLQYVHVFHESCMCFHGFPRCSIIFQPDFSDFHGFYSVKTSRTPSRRPSFDLAQYFQAVCRGSGPSGPKWTSKMPSFQVWYPAW